jgi:hypothetical protein
MKNGYCEFGSHDAEDVEVMLVLVVWEQVAGEDEGDADSCEEADVAPDLYWRSVFEAILNAC